MDPQRKRTARLVVALGIAVLLAAALVYTSFSASTEAKQPSEILNASPDSSYDLTGVVVPGSIHHRGSELDFRVDNCAALHTIEDAHCDLVIANYVLMDTPDLRDTMAAFPQPDAEPDEGVDVAVAADRDEGGVERGGHRDHRRCGRRPVESGGSVRLSGFPHSNPASRAAGTHHRCAPDG